MKYVLLTFLIALTATVSSSAQTLQVDPIYVGGTAAFEVQGGTPGGVAIVCYSMNGTGPFTLANGLSLDLSMPIRQLNPMVLNGIGDGYLGPFPTPSSAIVGMQVWFQAVDVNIWGSQILSATNMVPITVQQYPPTAVDDNAIAHAGVQIAIDVMDNDSDVDGDTISLFSVSTPTNGSASINGSGSIDYISAMGYIGIDTFQYVIEDTFGAQATATVFVDVIDGGTLVSWGYDIGAGQVSDTPTGNDFLQVSAGGWHSVALKSDGTLESWGTDTQLEVSNTPTTNDFIQAAAGDHHSVALKLDGTLVSWGSDSHGQVSDTPAGNDFIQVSAGGWHSVALRSDGSLFSWGRDTWGQVSGTPGGNDFAQVSAGSYHMVALRTDGTLVSWGDDWTGQVTDTPTINGFAQVSAGDHHSVALRSDGTLVSWGSDGSGEVSNTPTTNDFAQVSAGYYYSIALRADGSIVSWGYDTDGQVSNTPSTNDFIQVSGGGYHSLVIKR